MIKLSNILLEETYKMYRTYMYIEFNDQPKQGDKKGMDISTLANIIRGLPQVAVINNKSDKEDTKPRALFSVKIATTLPPAEAFQILQKDVMTKVSEVKKCKISQRHIEEVNL